MRRLLTLAATAVLVTACAGEDSPVSTTSVPGGDTTVTSVGVAAPLDDRITFVVGLLNGDELTETDYVAAFTPEFIDNVSYPEFVAVIDQLSATGDDFSVVAEEERSDLGAVVVVAPASGEPAYRAHVSLESVIPFRMMGLLLQPTEPPTLNDPPADLESAADRLGQLGTLSVLAAEVSDSDCSPIFSRDADRVAPIGSIFKLYVLAALVDAVDAGDIDWSDDIVISEELKSVPTGVLQNEDAGETFTVREVAEAMIALSDNTATDHLIDALGRESVEAAFAAWGMAEPDRNIPLLNTLELTALKIGPAAGLADQWLDSDEAERREIIQQISDLTPADLPLAEFDRPIRPDEIEWFATPEDLCRVLTALVDRGEPITSILSINPGIPDPAALFSTISFKGGSEPGLVAMSWLTELSDGRRFFLAGSVVDPDEDLDQLEAVLLFGAMRDLLADG
ncbi:serine hydrolase [soil metagenome]